MNKPKGGVNKMLNNQSNSHPLIFSISIFESAQQFIAVYLAIESENQRIRRNGSKHLQRLLERTKSPAIALTYTKEFILQSMQSQIQLTIIRFISQLSDLSNGKSMQSSLSYVIQNSSFLTQLRHNLTHRVMVKGMVIERGKQMILRQLKDKYWKVMLQKLWKTYHINEQKVEQIFKQISQMEKGDKFKQFEKQQEQTQRMKQEMRNSRIFKEYSKKLIHQQQQLLKGQYLFNQCQSNYQFKSLIKAYITRKVIPSILKQNNSIKASQNTAQTKALSQKDQQDCQQSISINQQTFLKYFDLSALTSHSHFSTRIMILLSTLLQLIVKCNSNNHNLLKNSSTRLILSHLIVLLIKLMPKYFQQSQSNNKKNISNYMQLLSSPLILNKFKQIYLLKYLQQFQSIIQIIPEQIIQKVHSFWKQQQISKNIKIII